MLAAQRVAAGAGANLALACDFVVAAEEASFIQAFINIGLVPDTGGTWSLPHLVGHARATALLMLGEKIGARQAAEWGLIYRAVPLPSLEAEAGALAAKVGGRGGGRPRARDCVDRLRLRHVRGPRMGGGLDRVGEAQIAARRR